MSERRNTHVTCKHVRHVGTHGDKEVENVLVHILLAAVNMSTVKAVGRGELAKVLIRTSTAVTF